MSARGRKAVEAIPRFSIDRSSAAFIVPRSDSFSGASFQHFRERPRGESGFPIAKTRHRRTVLFCLASGESGRNVCGPHQSPGSSLRRARCVLRALARRCTLAFTCCPSRTPVDSFPEILHVARLGTSPVGVERTSVIEFVYGWGIGVSMHWEK